jgi:hypothetical protein
MERIVWFGLGVLMCYGGVSVYRNARGRVEGIHDGLLILFIMLSGIGMGIATMLWAVGVIPDPPRSYRPDDL